MAATVVSFGRIFLVRNSGDLEHITTEPAGTSARNGFFTEFGFRTKLAKSDSKYVAGTDGNVYRRQKDYILKPGERIFRTHSLDVFYIE